MDSEDDSFCIIILYLARIMKGSVTQTTLFLSPVDQTFLKGTKTNSSSKYILF